MGENGIGIKLAPWMLTTLATVLIAIMTLTVRASVRTGRTEATVESNSAEIKKLDVVKADHDVMEMTYDAVLRLENRVIGLEGKLDQHIVDSKE